MKGVDAIGPMLEPQATDGPQAKTKDGKQFDAVLAEVVEKDPARAKGAKIVAATGEKAAQANDKSLLAPVRSSHGVAQGAAVQAAIPELVATPETLVTPKLDALEDVEEPGRELEEPKTAQQDQVVLAQIASVVARIVAPSPQAAPVQAPKQDVAATGEVKVAQPMLPSPAPANDVAPPVRAQDFNDALHGVQIVPHDAHEALTVRPGAGESSAPATGEELPRGPIGRALQALKGDGAPMRAAADKVMTAFRALSGREQAPLVSTPTMPAPAPAMMANIPEAPSSAAPNAAARAGASTHKLEVAGNAAPPPALAPAQTPTLRAPAAAPASEPLSPELPTVRPGVPQRTPSHGQLPTITVSAPSVLGQPIVERSDVVQPAVGEPALAPAAVEQAAVARPASGPSAVGQSAVGQPAVGLPAVAQPVSGQAVPGQAVQGQAQALNAQPPEQPQVAPQPPQAVRPQQASAVPQQLANTNATPPVQVQVQPQPEAVGEEAAREQPAADKSEGESRERVHGFSRGGWTDQARSAYGGRGHEGSSDRGGSERGETGRTVKREEERATERAAEQAAPQFLREQLVPEPQLTQAPQQAQETPNANVPQNQPAAPAAPVQELPDIVFQGRPDPTAATENATISLHHPDLGPIQLEVHRELGRVEVHAVIESQHAQAVLRANENGIRQGVQQAGMTFNALRVRVRGEEPTSNNRPGQERRRRSNERET
jgi:hypothetical protein